MNKKYICEIAEALSEKHAALMIGAGFSKNAEKITVTDRKFLNWNELSDRFYEAVYGTDKGPGKEYNSSLRLAQEVEITIGRPKLEKIIKDAVPDMEYAPSELYVKLMELPWKDVFTTNYDTLLERAAERVTKRRYNVVVAQEDLVNSADAPRILKLHGSFPSHRPFIITEEDYRTYPIKFAAMVNTVQQALLENVFCMIGFSCEDPNFINWIGWIHDNLGKSSSQKMYMISVSHMEEAKRKLLFNRNIVVVDLEELWPEMSIGERLLSFLAELQAKIQEKEKMDNWFDFGKLNISYTTGLQKKTTLMRELNDSYPGWIFLPWKMKNKANYVLRELDNFSKFDELSIEDQLEYMYEYVRLMDICGRPLMVQTAELFWERLDKNGWECADSKIQQKIGTVYLNLLRTYREIAEWEKYDKCHEKLHELYLDYDSKQFLYASDCWSCLFRFKAENLSNLLEKWELAKGDMYWPLIKASMFALIGEIHKADELLMDNLVLVRKQLVKENGNEYLSSIEESVVSLVNFIRQGNHSMELEECIHEGEISWWNENDKYCLNLNVANGEHKSFEMSSNFDLSVSYTMHMGYDNTDVLYALEYLRFLEQTGHPFRLQNVTNTKGLQNAMKKLAPYYPHWCLMQILIAQEKKLIDLLFGRAKLAELSREEVDNTAREYIEIFHTLIKSVKPQNYFFAKSIYEQSAVVLPEIMSRFCYKCSVNVLDELLDLTLELSSGNARTNFKMMDKLLKAMMQVYTAREQRDRINKILSFPMENDRINNYYDPITYLKKEDKKYNLDAGVYSKVLLQIRQALENGNSEEKAAALNRLIVLEQVIVLEAEDTRLLCEILEKEDSLDNNYILYVINKKKYESQVDNIFHKIVKRMELDSNSGSFASGSSNYRTLIHILSDVDIHGVNMKETFDVMNKLVIANVSWIKREQYEAKERIRQSFMIAVGLVCLYKNSELVLKAEEKEAIKSYYESLREAYDDSLIIKMIIAQWINGEKMSDEVLEKELLLSGNEDLELLRDFYDILRACNYSLETDEEMLHNTNVIFSAVAYKMLSGDFVDCISTLNLYYALLKNEEYQIKKVGIVDAYLFKLVDETKINGKDSEQVALQKLKCRLKACLIAKELHLKDIGEEGVYRWKMLSQCEEEFMEIRSVCFEDVTSE